ncbi:MAG: GNAT family acetyltransferase [Pseudomonadota bacterium]|nr:GNAT family acetyltransferase [Pseudomonadota bacterium]
MTVAGLTIRDFMPPDTASVISLWEACGLTRPWNDPQKDISRKMTDNNGCFWVAEVSGVVVASIMIGYDGHRGSINYLAIAPEHQRSGLGAKLMRRAEAYLIERKCPKVSICVRKNNEAVLAFYRQLGFEIDEVHFLAKRLISDV